MAGGGAFIVDTLLTEMKRDREIGLRSVQVTPLGATTAYDMANAISATARDRTDVAGRLTLEEEAVAHRYLTRRTA